MKKLTVLFVSVALLLNAMTPTLAYAATYLQGTESMPIRWLGMLIDVIVLSHT